MKKSELITYLNLNTKGRKAGRKEFKPNDIFISSSNDDKHLRLTAFGKNVMEKHFTAYTISLDTKTKQETGTQLITLDKYLSTPYYIKNGNLILFEESVAAELILIGGDFDLWVSNKR